MAGTDAVIYENDDFIIINKPVGFDSEKGVPLLLKEQGIECKPVHRLDKEVGGIMLLSRSANGDKMLSACDFEKTYLAVCRGIVEEESGTMEDYLFHDKTKNKTYAVKKMRTGVKKAELDYKVVRRFEDGDKTLVLITLKTGRTHQIRAQFASRRHPLVGDGKYGGGSGKPMLVSYRLSFVNPLDGEELTAVCLPHWDELDGVSETELY